MEEKGWMKQAEADLDVAKYNIDGGKVESGVFFLQQSAEKSLKALYIKKFKSLLKTHDLFILAQRLDAPSDILNYCKRLTPLYSYTRYPDAPKIKNFNEKIPELIKFSEEIIR